MSTLVVVIGAGASHDCFSSVSSTGKNASFTPPLVNDLFDKNGSFANILAQYKGAEMLAGDIRRKLSANESLSLESLLREIFDRPGKLLRAAWEIPLYLQELLGEVSVHHVSGPTNYDALVSACENSAYDQIVILTLNYDLLLEQALSKLGYEYKRLNQYVEEARKIKLIKVHGSVDWGKEVVTYVPNSHKHFTTVLNALEDGVLRLSDTIEILSGHHDGDRFIEGKFMYPALAIPVEDKTEFVCSGSHVSYLKGVLQEEVDFLCVGFSGHDDHILKLFKSVPKVPKLQIVGHEGSARQLYDMLVSVNSVFQRWDPEAVCCEDGFNIFVSGGELDNFF